ncbi:hypothetical protein ABZY09_47680 [Streptomyces sp. NPDC002928]|uniref:hypothetical protein n=1 Tax=Streptomyces sp. NPDC002928 TaxID=3154440 RepID=UPI0033A38169
MADMTAGMHEFWPHVLEAVKNRRRFTWILLEQHTEVLFYDGATLTLSAPNQGIYDNLVNSGGCDVLDEALDQVLHTRPAVELVAEGGAPLALPRSTPEGPATEVRVSVAVTTSASPSSRSTGGESRAAGEGIGCARRVPDAVAPHRRQCGTCCAATPR